MDYPELCALIDRLNEARGVEKEPETKEEAVIANTKAHMAALKRK